MQGSGGLLLFGKAVNYLYKGFTWNNGGTPLMGCTIPLL